MASDERLLDHEVRDSDDAVVARSWFRAYRALIAGMDDFYADLSDGLRGPVHAQRARYVSRRDFWEMRMAQLERPAQ